MTGKVIFAKERFQARRTIGQKSIIIANALIQLLPSSFPRQAELKRVIEYLMGDTRAPDLEQISDPALEKFIWGIQHLVERESTPTWFLGDFENRYVTLAGYNPGEVPTVRQFRQRLDPLTQLRFDRLLHLLCHTWLEARRVTS